MAHTVSGTLRKAPFIKDGCGQDGQSKMYGIELSEMVKDFKTDEKTYSNYKAIFFAKSDAARGYYDKAFAEGSFVVVSCEKLKVEQREHNGKTYISLQMENSRLEGAKFEESGQPQQQQHGYGQQTPQQQQQQQGYAPQPQQNHTPYLDDGWSDDI